MAVTAGTLASATGIRLFFAAGPVLLRKEFELTAFQLQSQEWSSKCCGMNLLNLHHWADKLDRARRRRDLRKVREQIAGELAQLEANRKK